MDLQTLATGGFFLVILVSAVLTAPLSIFLLWLYRRAVLKGMNVAMGAAEPSAPPSGQAPPGIPLRIAAVTRALGPPAAQSSSALDREATRSLRRLALAYTVAGLVFAAVFAGVSAAQAGGGFLPIRYLILTVIFSWPIVLALIQLAALGWRDRVGAGVLYLAILAIVGALPWLLDAHWSIVDLIGLWLIINGPATLLLAAFLTRRIRAVGPLVLLFVSAGVTGALLLQSALASNDTALRLLAGTAVMVGLGGRAAFVLVLVSGFAALAILGWGLLRLIGRRYRQKRMSDQSLTLDAMWLLFALAGGAFLASGGWRYFLFGPVAFIMYKVVLWGMFARFVRPVSGAGASPTLLLLRVFSLGSHSLRLFDAFTKVWLRAGPIALIAGPDLVTGIVEPPEFLDFVGGRMSRRFVQGREDLEQRLDDFDARPDPDGRYRVNEFFCRADTWQMTMQQLAARSDAVLMDLRSFSPTNQGCLFELGQLLAIVPLPQVLLIMDRTTETRLIAAWPTRSCGCSRRTAQEPAQRRGRCSTCSLLNPASCHGVPHRRDR